MKVKNLATGVAIAAAVGLTGVLGAGSAAAAPAPSTVSAELPAQRAAASWHQVEMWYDMGNCIWAGSYKSYPTTCAYGQFNATGTYGYVLWGWY